MVEVRKETGADTIAIIVNQTLKIKNRKPVSDTTCYSVLARNGLVEAEKKIQVQYNKMSRPDELIQADITTFNGVPIMTMGYSRMGWATSMITEEKVTNAMKKLHPDKYENLITDNGSQFSRKNSNMRHYCEHYWSSYGHRPQTMGKLSICRRDSSGLAIALTCVKQIGVLKSTWISTTTRRLIGALDQFQLRDIEMELMKSGIQG